MKIIAASAAAALLMVGSLAVQANAQTSGATAKNGVVTSHQFVKTRSGEKEVSCRGFMGLEDKFKPEAVAYAIGYNKAKRPDDAVVDVTGVNSLVPVVVSTCVTTPAAPLHAAVAKSLKK